MSGNMNAFWYSNGEPERSRASSDETRLVSETYIEGGVPVCDLGPAVGTTSSSPCR